MKRGLGEAVAVVTMAALAVPAASRPALRRPRPTTTPASSTP